jgi:hypothetical protein
MVVVAPAALLAWAWAAWARPRVCWWVLPAIAALIAAAAAALRVPLQAAYAALGGDLLAAVQAPGLRPSWALLGGVAGLFARSLVITSPIGLPIGLIAGMVRGQPAGRLPSPAAPRRLERPSAQRSPYLGRVLRTSPPGDLPAAWHDRGYLVLPELQSRLSRLAIGRPHAGKSVYIQRETYLAGRLARRATLIDCKGEPGFAAEVLAAYRAGWRDGGHPGEPTAHVWPAEPLNVWTGGPAAVANRLLACWTFDLAAQWYREVVGMTLRLALHAPGDPVTRSGELVYRMQPGVLARLWEEHPDESALIRSLGKDHRLDDVAIRVSNLMASLGATLDGTRPLGTADCAVLSLPVMASEADAAAVLRVALADLAHHVVARKDPAARELIVVDEFSAVPGGREHAIHLTERGRSAGVAVLLSVQSDRGLGDDAEADRLIGAVGTVALFATAEPERIIRLAGTRRIVEQTSTSIGDDGTARATSTVQWRDAVDANIVRALQPGQAFILAGGRWELVQIIRPPAPGSSSGEDRPPAGGTLRPPAPGDAVDERDYPALRGRVKPSPPATLRATGLDPPTRAGSGDTDASGGWGQPPDDRNNT